MELKKFLKTGLTILVLDTIVLKVLGFGATFINMVVGIQDYKFEAKMLGVFIAYLLLIIQVYYFVIYKKMNILESFILGLTTYGIFDFTNYALFKDYKLKVGIMDTLWGGILYALTNVIVNNMLN
jgi:uncharacterized membrane protein